MNRRGFTLMEVMVVAVIIALFTMGLTAVFRGAESAHRAGIIRSPLGMSARNVRAILRERVRAATCLQSPGSDRLIGFIGQDCDTPPNDLDSANPARYFIFCFDSTNKRLLLEEGDTPAPSSCTSSDSSVVSGALVEATGGFALSAVFPNKVVMNSHLQVTFNETQKDAWQEEPFLDISSTFTAGGVLQTP